MSAPQSNRSNRICLVCTVCTVYNIQCSFYHHQSNSIQSNPIHFNWNINRNNNKKTLNYFYKSPSRVIQLRNDCTEKTILLAIIKMRISHQISIHHRLKWKMHGNSNAIQCINMYEGSACVFILVKCTCVSVCVNGVLFSLRSYWVDRVDEWTNNLLIPISVYDLSFIIHSKALFFNEYAPYYNLCKFYAIFARTSLVTLNNS